MSKEANSLFRASIGASFLACVPRFSGGAPTIAEKRSAEIKPNLAGVPVNRIC
jgi:hypothetical protein